MKKSLLVITTIFFLAGCGKEDLQKDRSTKETSLAMPKMEHTMELSGIKNPYDPFGMRTAMLIKELRQYAESTGDTTAAGIDHYLYRHYGHKPLNFPKGEALKQDYKTVLFGLPWSPAAKQLAKELIGATESLEQQYDYAALNKKVAGVEIKIHKSALIQKEKNCLLMMASVIRYGALEFIGQTSQNSPVLMRGIGGILRKVAGVITAIAAGASVAAWHYLKNTPYDYAAEEVGRWAFICGYYTGWYPEK